LFGCLLGLSGGLMAAEPDRGASPEVSEASGSGAENAAGIAAARLLFSVFFQPGAEELAQADVERLKAFALAWKDEGQTLIVRGMTEQVGSREMNLALGMRRALLVSKVLQQQGLRRVQIVSFGEELSGQDCADAPAQCRRVDLLER
jgi:outer membrane protein OmpA-like peptidoglycan-associated protein